MVTRAEHDTVDETKRHRRAFLKSAALGGAAAVVTGCSGDSADGAATPRTMSSGSKNSSTSNGRISVQSVNEAAKLQGISYTDKEYEQMLATLEQRLGHLRILRAREFHNDQPPAHIFNPKLSTIKIRSQKNRFSFHEKASESLPTSNNDIAFASISTLGQMLRSGALSSVELTQIYLDRIAQYDESLWAFVTVTSDLALSQAEKADKDLAAGRDRGPLHGMPYGLKDIVDTKDIRTTWGAELYRERVPDKDAEIVRKLKRAGAVLLGKTSCGALALGDEWFGGITRNPWNVAEGSSGSSAGSAAAVSAGLCSFAIGSETLGSIISPSERSGVFGLRPTFGRVSRAGVMSLAWSLDKIGPMGRSAEDTAAVLSELNGYDADDPSAARMGFTYDNNLDVSGLKVGYVPDWFEKGDDTDRAAIKAASDLGLNMTPIVWPQASFEALVEIVNVEAAAAFADLTLMNTDDGLIAQNATSWPNKWRAARFVSAVDFIQIDRLRRQLMVGLAAIFDEVDVLIGPHYADGALLATNCTGNPQIAVPFGFDQTPSRDLFNRPLDGGAGETFQTPRGISLWSGLFQEGPMIAIAHALQSVSRFNGARPPGF